MNQGAGPFELQTGIDHSSEPEWVSRGQSARLESLAVSIGSWLAVLILSAWFCFWLVESVSRVATKLP